MQTSRDFSSPRSLVSSFLGMSGDSTDNVSLPHRGSLARVSGSGVATYVLTITLGEEATAHSLEFGRRDFELAQNLFSILDTESRGWVDRRTVEEFATLRCPVLWRRDEDLRLYPSRTKTFEEIWNTILECSQNEFSTKTAIGIEGWLVFCRLLALAQYLEAKRRFSARHLQQTMRHRNAPRGSEVVVVVDVPPAEPPTALTSGLLAEYNDLPLPELDLDHSLVAAHDHHPKSVGSVKVSLFGSSYGGSYLPPTAVASSTTSKHLEFALTYSKRINADDLLSAEDVVVRRTMEDMKWLHETFSSHRKLGGTLCGRILPPFPSGIMSAAKDDSVLKSSIKTSIKTTGGALKSGAVAGVGKLRSAAKTFQSSFFGSVSSSGSSSAEGEGDPSSPAALPKKKASKGSLGLSMLLPGSYYNPSSPVYKARQLERYLNYLMEHPALSTSFPLNTILQASQSGLEAAKDALEECTRASKEMNQHGPQLGGDDKAMMWSSESASFAWVRTAAQAAMALQVHGMLETTGMPSASARLQHAALPSLGSTGGGRGPGWGEDTDSVPHNETGLDVHATLVDPAIDNENRDFEVGVVTVDSGLGSDSQVRTGDEGYDLLPLPVPAPERRILCAGSDRGSQAQESPERETRFHYGTASFPGRISLEDDETSGAFLGELSVDDNIDKLREVIGSVDNTLSKCLTSIGRIGKSQRDRQLKHLEVVRGLDSWSGMRGRFVSQRSLMKGVTCMEQSKDVYEESDLALADDLSWQASLATSAVSAAEDVRKAVRVSRTASNAKAAASAASFAAQNVCETGDFATMDEARAAQTRASIAQSHAIHAAVVEHEAKSIKRRAALALANDVKCWNQHRKREMLKSCLDYARSQHEATRRAVDAWSGLKDGFIGSTVIPSALERKATAVPTVPEDQTQSRREPSVEHGEVSATIFSDPEGSEQPSIVAVDHNILTSAAKGDKQVDKIKAVENFETESILPFATADPITEEEDEEDVGDLPARDSSFQSRDESCGSKDEVMSASMQSLVDGLMAWGGGVESEEEHFALPAGMAASIVMEESNNMIEQGMV